MGKLEEVKKYFENCVDNRNKTVTLVHKFFDKNKTIYTNEGKVGSTLSDIEMLNKNHGENRKIVERFHDQKATTLHKYETLTNPQQYFQSQGFFDNYGNYIDATEVSEKKFTCNLCIKSKKNETFSEKSILDHFYAKHSIGKCLFCSFSYSSKNEYDQHYQNIHFSQNCFLCKTASTSNLYLLYNHLMNEHQKEFECLKKCEINFLDQSCEKEHLTKVHNKPLPAQFIKALMKNLVIEGNCMCAACGTMTLTRRKQVIENPLIEENFD